jgi:uncharacterized lipoprotein YddW (UPF0748 family)
MKKYRFIFPLALCSLVYAVSFTQTIPPKREFRGVWVATVDDIDWPLHKGEPPAVQQQELVSMLDNLKSTGINAVIFQVRPECDALYRSSIEPWSYWLTGEQGKAPSPMWDPLRFAIEEAHKRGMELHAWFNPYRAVKSSLGRGNYQLAPNHVAVQHPDWILTFGSMKLLDPGLPAVRAYVTKVILDVVRRYDVDGIHFDDYFYPYSPITNEDSLTFLHYNRGFTNLADWRRDNVNLLVKMIHDSISVIKPWVKFGISPFGIWKNKIADGGAGTNGFEAYDKLYCDALEWLHAGTIDYVTPQIYWSIGNPPAAYDLLTPWWSKHTFGRDLYIGQAAYRNGNGRGDPHWFSTSQMPDQMRLNRETSNVSGSIFFSSKSITRNQNGFQDSLKEDFYSYPALLPAMHWKDAVPPLPPKDLKAAKTNGEVQLHWEAPPFAIDGDSAYRFAVYRSFSQNDLTISDAKELFCITPDNSTSLVDEFPASPGTELWYVATSLDRLWNESLSSNVTAVRFFDLKQSERAPLQNLFSAVPVPSALSPAFVAVPLQIPAVVELKLYDRFGRKVSTIFASRLNAGHHSLYFPQLPLPDGLYSYHLQTSRNTRVGTVLVRH